MTAQEVAIWRNMQANKGFARFFVRHLAERDGLPPSVDLVVVVDGAESDHSLEPGDTFPVQDQEWKLDRIEDLDSPGGDWTVVLSRVK
ncbi:DUF6406 domain-containing protein [Streptomyces asoensis]|uniref:DUF6406 domain-containing protein n=1 Tax=Streptomyces asoensis TaxID=249586 RepID=UPI0033CD87A7